MFFSFELVPEAPNSTLHKPAGLLSIHLYSLLGKSRLAFIMEGRDVGHVFVWGIGEIYVHAR